MCADSVSRQLRRDEECPFSGVTNSGSLEEGAESDARSVAATKATRLTQEAQASVPAGGDSGGEDWSLSAAWSWTTCTAQQPSPCREPKFMFVSDGQEDETTQF